MKKIIFLLCIMAAITSCKKDMLPVQPDQQQQEQQQQPKSEIEGGLNVTIEKGQMSGDGVAYNQVPAWLSIWNTQGHVLDIRPTNALQGITNDITANKTIAADYHNNQACVGYHVKLAPGTYMVFVMLSLPGNTTGQFAYSYKTFTITPTSGYIVADKKFSYNVANAVFENWN